MSKCKYCGETFLSDYHRNVHEGEECDKKEEEHNNDI